MPDQLVDHVKRMQAEGVPEADIIAFVHQFDTPVTPAVSHGAAPKSSTNPVDKLYDDALGGQGSDAGRRFMHQMTDGVMGGGLSSAAPTAIGAAVQEFAPGVSKLLKGGAERMYSGLLKAKDATVERFPNVVKDLIASGTTISQGGRAKTISTLKSIGGEKNALLKAADERAMVPRETLRSGLDNVLDDAIKTSDAPVKDMGKLARIERDLIPDEPGVLPSRADKIKTKLQSESDRAYRAMKIGTKVNDTTAKAKTGIALRAKEAVEAIEPGMKDVNARYASNKGQAEALREALKRTDKHGVIGINDLIGGTLGLAGGPAGVPMGVAAMRLATNPRIGSNLAIGVDRLSRIPNLDQATKAAMIAMLKGSDQ